MGLSIYISCMCMGVCMCVCVYACIHTKSGNPTWGEWAHRPLSPWWEYPVASGVMEMGSSSQEQINITWKYKKLLKDLAETRAKTGHTGYSECWGQTPSLGSRWLQVSCSPWWPDRARLLGWRLSQVRTLFPWLVGVRRKGWPVTKKGPIPSPKGFPDPHSWLWPRLLCSVLYLNLFIPRILWTKNTSSGDPGTLEVNEV